MVRFGGNGLSCVGHPSVAFCGKDDRATSVTETWEAGGSWRFCLAPTIDAHRSAAFASRGLGASDEFY